MPTNMYRMPMGHGGQMAPPPGMEMGMQYFMPPEAGGGMGYMDGSQQHHPPQQQQQQPQSLQPQPQQQHPQSHQQQQQQQLMLMQVCRVEEFFAPPEGGRIGAVYEAVCIMKRVEKLGGAVGIMVAERNGRLIMWYEYPYMVSSG